jgi:hypothetical protein
MIPYLNNPPLAGEAKPGSARQIPVLHINKRRRLAAPLNVFILIIFLCISSAHSYGQWLNFGNGNDGTKTVGITEYTDNVEYAVLEYNYNNSSPFGPYLIEVKIAGITAATNFAYQDRVLIADMSVSASFTGRNYDLAEVWYTTDDGTNSFIYCYSAGTVPAAMHVLNGTQTLTQIMRVNQWTDVNFKNGGVLTCHPWDESAGIGGILAFVNNGNLDLKNYGTIDATDKGPQGVTSVAGGVPGIQNGTGGMAGMNIEGDGDAASGIFDGDTYPSNGGISLHNPCSSQYRAGGNGGCGTGAKDGTGPFPGLRTHYFPTPSLFNTMSFNAGTSGKSGQGPGSGGNGGGGGAGRYVRGNAYALAPQDGTTGTAGTGNGGRGGKGGNGGGLIYIKSYNIITGNRGPVIISNGTDASDGADAVGLGGNGGDGGKGGNGYCADYAPGGGGGKGQGGNGPDGGDGGDGGPGGDIWIGTFNPTITTSDLEANGGNGGMGGLGMPAGVNGAQGANGGFYNLCSTLCNANCTSLSYISTYDEQACCATTPVCSPDDAMRILATMQNAALDPLGFKYSNPTYSSGSDPRNYAVWNVNNLTLNAYEWVPATGGTCSGPATNGTFHHYYANFNCPSFSFWGNLGNTIPMQPCTFNFGTWYWSTGITLYATYITGGTITDFTVSPNQTCSSAKCTSSSGGGGGQGTCTRPCHGKTGFQGSPGPAGNLGISSEFPGSGSDPTGPTLGIENITADYKLQLMPNPATDMTMVKFNADNQSDFILTVTDIQGKEIYSHLISATKGENAFNIKVKDFQPGNYIITLRGKDAQQKIKFVKN